MHPRVCIDQLCFPGLTIDQFVDRCIDLNAHSIVVSSLRCWATDGASIAKRDFGQGAAGRGDQSSLRGVPGSRI